MGTSLKRVIIILIGVILQILLSLSIYLFFVEHLFIIHLLFLILGLLLTFNLIRTSKNYSYILPVIIILIIFPLIGTLFYLLFKNSKNRSKNLKRIRKSENENRKYLVQSPKVREEFKNEGRMRYFSDFLQYPITKNNEVTYYPIGEKAFVAMIEELKKAEKFIFFEYFIVNHGKMWDSILEILEEKAKNGVDVRVMYDDFGCITTLKKSYPQELEKKGIKCVAFNRLNVIAGVFMNNRDHRKILVIDGKVAFSGGINIADEYINIRSRYGHWKDNGIKVEGEAVWNYTVMFLTMWNAFRNDDKDFKKFKSTFKNKYKNDGYVVPYGTTPLDEETTGEDVYLNIINQAEKYIYIFTPYLIIDNNIINALSLAVKRGVDVRIIIPGIPDKKIVYTLSESYVELLVKSGVKIYKYLPGFVHSKVFVADDNIATVGTINMDYRSLYLHFECGCYLQNLEVIKEIKNDLVESMKKSHLVTLKEISPKLLKSIWQAILRIIAPLM